MNINREFEIYNNSIGGIGSTEYDNALINKDIDNYFNDMLNKPIPNQITNIKSTYTFNKFYSEYIEHNLIFIVVLVGIIIFLIIRHYVKEFDNVEPDLPDLPDLNDKIKNNSDNNLNELKKKSKKIQMEKIKLINYKKELDKEKQQILSIIDELSNINDNETYMTNKNQMYLDNDINTLSNNINTLNNNQNKYLSNNRHLNKSEQKLSSFNDNNDDNNSQYYNINGKQDKKSNEIDGLYIEPPFM